VLTEPRLHARFVESIKNRMWKGRLQKTLIAKFGFGGRVASGWERKLTEGDKDGAFRNDAENTKSVVVTRCAPSSPLIPVERDGSKWKQRMFLLAQY
jgi:hypothetical protein